MKRTKYIDLKTFIKAKGWTERRAGEYFGCSTAMISRVIHRLRKPGGRMTVKMLAAGIDVMFHLDTNITSDVLKITTFEPKSKIIQRAK